jgi:hypothetical protein
MRRRDRVQQPRENPLRRRRAPRLRPQPQRQAHEQRAQPRGPCAQPPQPSAYRRLGHPQHGRDRPMPATGRAHPKRRPDRRREVHPPSHQERRQQRVRHPAGRAATAPHPERQHPRSPAHQPPIAAPSSQPPIAARAALTGQPRAHAPAQHLLDQMSLDDYDQQRRKPRGPSRSAKNRGASFLSGAHHRARHASAPLHRPSARPRAPARKTVQNPSGFAQQRQLLRHPQPQRRRSSSTSSNNVALYTRPPPQGRPHPRPRPAVLARAPADPDHREPDRRHLTQRAPRAAAPPPRHLPRHRRPRPQDQPADRPAEDPPRARTPRAARLPRARHRRLTAPPTPRAPEKPILSTRPRARTGSKSLEKCINRGSSQPPNCRTRALPHQCWVPPVRAPGQDFHLRSHTSCPTHSVLADRPWTARLRFAGSRSRLRVRNLPDSRHFFRPKADDLSSGKEHAPVERRVPPGRGVPAVGTSTRPTGTAGDPGLSCRAGSTSDASPCPAPVHRPGADQLRPAPSSEARRADGGPQHRTRGSPRTARGDGAPLRRRAPPTQDRELLTDRTTVGVARHATVTAPGVVRRLSSAATAECRQIAAATPPVT